MAQAGVPMDEEKEDWVEFWNFLLEGVGLSVCEWVCVSVSVNYVFTCVAD